MKSRLLGVLNACVLTVGLISHPQAVPIIGQGTWETTLQARDLDGDPATIDAYYDTLLNITWLANANLAFSNTFGVAGIGGDGRMNWNKTNEWIAAMNTDGGTGYLGFSNWRQPTLSPINGVSFNFDFSNNATTDRGYALPTTDGTDGGWRDGAGNPVSELGHMFSVNLGNSGICLPNGSGSSTTCDPNPAWIDFPNANYGPFSGVQLSYYTGLEGVPNSQGVWHFDYRGGDQIPVVKINKLWVWPVHPGDAISVPEPSTLALLGIGLAGLLFVKRRKEQQAGSSVVEQR